MQNSSPSVSALLYHFLSLSLMQSLLSWFSSSSSSSSSLSFSGDDIISTPLGHSLYFISKSLLCKHKSLKSPPSRVSLSLSHTLTHPHTHTHKHTMFCQCSSTNKILK